MPNTPVPAASTAEVFISYSSHDRDKIAPVVQIVRALKKGLVFQDYASIVPGERWRDRVMDAITKATMLMVFWCEHSKASEHVRDEYETGIELGKEIVPILLDDTELPNPLREFHWIDLRRPEAHGGLRGFVPRVFERSKRHYNPKDEHGEYRDWDYEDYSARERERQNLWNDAEAPRRQAVAETIVSWLDSRRV
jgi:hypothetical protein